jgi:hypothetical protein
MGRDTPRLGENNPRLNPCPHTEAGLRGWPGTEPAAAGLGEPWCGIPSTSRTATTRQPGDRAERRRWRFRQGCPRSGVWSGRRRDATRAPAWKIVSDHVELIVWTLYGHTTNPDYPNDRRQQALAVAKAGIPRGCGPTDLQFVDLRFDVAAPARLYPTYPNQAQRTRCESISSPQCF